MTRTYYNEHDPFAAAWLRELIVEGVIAPGDVDERDIRDVAPGDLVGYTQCHFFAGIGGWSLALRLAGWPDDRPIWTGSCPCQPFSSAGKGDGFADPRHLWPSWFRLIQECRPVVIAGEQVEAAVRHGWLDLVFDDLEGLDYACGAVDLPSASIGTPNIRQRLWWLADAEYTERGEISLDRLDGRDGADSRREEAHGEFGARGEVLRVADANVEGSGGRGVLGPGQGDGTGTGAARERPAGFRADGWMAHPDRRGSTSGREGCAPTGHGEAVDADRGTVGLADPAADGRQHESPKRCVDGEGTESTCGGPDRGTVGVCGGVGHAICAGLEGYAGHVHRSDEPGRHDAHEAGSTPATSDVGRMGDTDGRDASDGHLQPIRRHEGLARGTVVIDEPRWPLPSHLGGRPVDWLLCRDGKWRPVESGTFPLAYELPARVGRLRGYGNAINPQVAAEVIRAYMEIAS